MVRLFVGNLPYRLDEQGLIEVFASRGITARSAHIPLDRATKSPRGFAFVEVEDSDVEAALTAGEDIEVMGRRIRVARAERREAPSHRTPPTQPPVEKVWAEDGRRGRRERRRESDRRDYR